MGRQRGAQPRTPSPPTIRVHRHDPSPRRFGPSSGPTAGPGSPTSSPTARPTAGLERGDRAWSWLPALGLVVLGPVLFPSSPAPLCPSTKALVQEREPP